MVSPVKSLLQQQQDDKNDTHCMLLVAARSLKMNSRVSSSLETLELYWTIWVIQLFLAAGKKRQCSKRQKKEEAWQHEAAAAAVWWGKICVKQGIQLAPSKAKAGKLSPRWDRERDGSTVQLVWSRARSAMYCIGASWVAIVYTLAKLAEQRGEARRLGSMVGWTAAARWLFSPTAADNFTSMLAHLLSYTIRTFLI